LTPEASDEQLMLAFKAGDARAFRVLVQRHRGPVFNFILRFTGHRARAEDVLQETWLKVVRGAPDYETKAKFTTWLYTIARNLCVDASRRGKHRKAYSLDVPMDKNAGNEGATLLDVVPDKSAGTDRKVMSKELHGRLHAAIGKLSEDQREVFLMREFLDMPFRDIAEVVGCPENTVWSRLHHARSEMLKMARRSAA